MTLNLIKYWFRISSNTDFEYHQILILNIVKYWFECHQDNDFDSHQNNDLISHLVKIMISTDFWVSAQNDSQASRWPSFKTMITFLQVFRHELKYLNYFKIVLGLCLYILVLHWCQSGWVVGGRWFEMRKIFLRYFTREWAITSASLTKCPFDVCNCVQNVKKYFWQSMVLVLFTNWQILNPNNNLMMVRRADVSVPFCNILKD